MTRGNKSANKPRGAAQDGNEQKKTGRPEAGPRGWANASKPPSRMIASGRKVPFGPVGGLGRKTNLARSS
jgi:hypothetical protein